MKVFLHVGYGKTGSSAIQSFLARNVDLLLQHDFDYPYHPSFTRAKNNQITSGNITIDDQLVDYIIKTARSARKNNVIFSNETLFREFLNDTDKLHRLKRELQIVVLLYLRDPLDHIASVYGQAVKRGGEKRKMDNWGENYNLLRQAAKFIRQCDDLDIEIRFRNYSRVDNLERDFLDLIGVEASDRLYEASDRRHGIVNRSLNRSEFELQRQFNRYYGKESHLFLSDPLVDQARDVKSDKPSFSDAHIARLIAKNADVIAEINARIGPENELRVATAGNSGAADDVYTFTGEQLEIIAKSISQHIHMAEDKSSDADATALRDIALKYETGESLSLEDAAFLMEKAQRARPGGLIIRRKLNEYRKRLAKLRG